MADLRDAPVPASARVREEYRERWTLREAERQRAATRSRELSNARALTFLGIGAAIIAWDMFDGLAASLALALAALLVVVFGIQVARHRRVRRQERWAAVLSGIEHEGVLRSERDWSALEAVLPARERVVPEPPKDHPYARDLDLVGTASLLRLLGPVTSERGRAVLLEWLLAAGEAPGAKGHQDAVRELAGMTDVRVRFAAYGRLNAPEALEGLDVFLRWAEDEPWFLRRPWLRRSAVVLPPVLLVTLGLALFAGAGPWWLLPAVAQLLVFRRAGPVASASFARAETGTGPCRSLVPQLRLLEETSFRAAHLRSIHGRLVGEGQGAHRWLERISNLLDTVESRRNLLYATLSPVLLLDVHLGAALDRWRGRHGARVREWLDAAGEWEALAALATLAHDHPEWCFPSVRGDEEVVLSAEALGHPLLRPEACVRNDVEVGPPGTFLLVTGSNMSGKSTLLRALGLNAVLAAAGAPVCAEVFSAPPLRVCTSMRIDDSLAAGVSLFMAELLRIRSVLDVARKAEAEGRPVLYLLDEMLHGTNTAERRVAARAIIRHLLATRAIGAVSTHDLTLAESPELERAARPAHFREDVRADGAGRETRITFDYRLRPGIATTRNALRLLEAVGLGDVLDAGEREAPRD